nr:reverse transcriptase domain-containing protein [Tanacetum cinerariifolium]
MSTRSSARNLFPPLDNPELTIRRRSRTDPTLLNNSEMAAEGPSDLPVPDLRTTEELCQPSLNGWGGPIAPIAIQATNFGLKNDMILQSIKVNGVTDDALRLYLFSHFLTHHATTWFDCLPRNSINTFEQMAKLFLGKYFPPSMVTKLRNEITNFRQHHDESLFEAWKRYKLSIDRCPNHNMLPVTQIDTFCNGLTLRHRDTINAAAGGTFMKRRPKECYDLTENMTAHHNDWDTSAQWSESSSSITSSFDTEIAALKAETTKINKNLMRFLQVNQQVKAVTPNCETCGGPHSFNDCPATVGNTQNVYAAGAYQGNSYQPQGNRNLLSYRSDKYLGLIQLKFMKMNTASSLGSRTLPGNTITNPKEDFKGITTRSGTAYQGPTIPTTTSSPPVVERETEATKDMVHPTNNGSTKDVQPPVNTLSLPDLSPMCMTLELADHLISRLVGVAEDVFVKVGELTLRVGKEAITFNLDQTSRYSANYNDMTANRIDVIDMACEEYSQEVLSFSDVIVSGNPTPYYDPIVSTTSPFKNSDFLLEEVDAFLALEDDPTLPEELKIYEAKTDKSSIDEPLEVELKDLPPHPEYAFLKGDNKLPVIISKDLSVEEKTALITVLKSHKKTLNQPFNISEGSILKSTMSSKNEVMKLLDVGLIYSISDSPWVSPIHCVPKKGGFTVIENEENELILTRLVMGWRVCIDYQKLNENTRKDHFPLPFMDQILERLAGNQYYCFLDGFSGYFQIPIDPKDQEKTTFTCPYRTFAYRHMPFGLCNDGYIP